MQIKSELILSISRAQIVPPDFHQWGRLIDLTAADHEHLVSSSSPAGAERAEVALRMQVDAICEGDPDCEEDIVVNGGGGGEGAEGAEGADELLLEPRPGRGGSSYYFRTRKDGLEVRPTAGLSRK